jgi:hypothetical protein
MLWKNWRIEDEGTHIITSDLAAVFLNGSLQGPDGSLLFSRSESEFPVIETSKHGMLEDVRAVRCDNI